MHQTSFPHPEAPPLLLRLRAGIASALLSVFGLQPSARRARWLTTVTLNAAARQANAAAIADAARRRLASLTDGAIMRHRASRETLPEIAQARAAMPTLAQPAQDAADAATRLEAMDGRHSYAIRAILRGAPIADVSEWLGHSSLATTYNTYVHFDGEVKRILKAGSGVRATTPSLSASARPTDSSRRSRTGGMRGGGTGRQTDESSLRPTAAAV